MLYRIAIDWNQTAGVTAGVTSEAVSNAEVQWVARSQHSGGGRAFRFDSDDGRGTLLAARF